MPINETVYDEKIRFYNKLYRAALLLLVLVAVIMCTIGARQVFVVGKKIDNNVLLVQSIITNNQLSSIEARKASVERDIENKNYIKCIFLIRYDNPNLTATSPRSEAEAALDKCAKVQ